MIRIRIIIIIIIIILVVVVIITFTVVVIILIATINIMFTILILISATTKSILITLSSSHRYHHLHHDSSTELGLENSLSNFDRIQCARKMKSSKFYPYFFQILHFRAVKLRLQLKDPHRKICKT